MKFKFNKEETEMETVADILFAHHSNWRIKEPNNPVHFFVESESEATKKILDRSDFNYERLE